jgi:hypothetical protein
MPPGFENLTKARSLTIFPGQAKTELCADVSNYLSLRFFRCEGLNSMSLDNGFNPAVFGTEAPI